MQTDNKKFQAGDIVLHNPSGEEWVLAVDEENGYVQPAGWPESMAEAKDCVLIEKSSDEVRMKMLETWAENGKGREHEHDWRTLTARKQLENL